MNKVIFWCGKDFLKERFKHIGVPCETEGEFEEAISNGKHIRKVWGKGDECFYEISVELAQEWQGVEYTEMWADEVRYINFKLPEPSNKPKQSTPFWANDWRKKHKR